MKLTSDYFSVLASFNHPTNFDVETSGIDPKRDGGYIFYNFYVGPLEYRLDLDGENGSWDVSFFLINIRGSEKELIEYYSKVLKRDVTPFEVPYIKRNFLNRATSNLNLGNAPEVFSNVLGIIKELIDNYTVECLTFISDDKKKADVYRRLFLRYLKGWFPVMDTGHHFKVCRMDD